MNCYDDINLAIAGKAAVDATEFCKEHLPRIWINEYKKFVEVFNVLSIDREPFTFLFDLSAEFADQISDDNLQEDRVVAAYGVSSAPMGKRDASRMKGFIGATEAVFGDDVDKGHFIAHSMGGDVFDTMNLFPQERNLNRGWSPEGKLYRSLEAYCANNPDTFCFSRPIYKDGTWSPCKIEFGLLREGRLEVYTFENNLPPRPIIEPVFAPKVGKPPVFTAKKKTQ